MNRRASFVQSDVTRAYKGAMAVGLDPREISIEIRPDGTMMISPVATTRPGQGAANSVDRILEREKR